MSLSIWSLPAMKHAAELGLGASGEKNLVLSGLSAEEEALLRKQLA